MGECYSVSGYHSQMNDIRLETDGTCRDVLKIHSDRSRYQETIY